MTTSSAASRVGWRGVMGLARSMATYYGVPGRARALRTLYGQLLAPGDLAFDVGAHVGHRTRALHALGVRVVAIEPQALLHRWLALTLPRGVALERTAVGARSGSIELAVSRRHPTVSSGSAAWRARVAGDDAFAGVDWDAVETVPQTTLDSLIAEHGRPRFCKIDVEGMEPEVLAGLSRPLACIAVEYVPAALEHAQDCLERLAALGQCRVNLVRAEAGHFAWGEWVSPAEAARRVETVAADGRHGDLYAWFPEAAAMPDEP